LVFAGQSQRIAAREPLQSGGPAVGERDRPARSLLERLATFTILGALAMLRGDPDGRGAEQLALARLACNVPEDHPEAPVFDAVLGLLDAHAELSARDPESRRPRVLLMLASSVARSPDVPLPAGV
ncbi:MAG TPA: hypothetical protein VFN65_09550, partial [Solirubrobacteraceae bacterium]|nr:hypothetical protein [Solirubrobacteraceae bacterium]